MANTVAPMVQRLQTILPLAAALLIVGCGSKPDYPSCDQDTDCQAGETCFNKRCVQCTKDADCDTGQTCEKGACVAKEGFCQTRNDCPNGEACINNSCTACQRDGDCGADGRCSEGRCLSRGQCAVDDDCADDEDCIDGTCQKPSAGGPSTADCTLETVYFDFDSSKVREDSRDKLAQTADCLLSVKDRNAYVEGHTDPRGTEEYNIALSEARAQTVVEYLGRLGVETTRLQVIPKGETEATGTGESSWAQDRKVKFEWQ